MSDVLGSAILWSTIEISLLQDGWIYLLNFFALWVVYLGRSFLRR